MKKAIICCLIGTTLIVGWCLNQQAQNNSSTLVNNAQQFTSQNQDFKAKETQTWGSNIWINESFTQQTTWDSQQNFTQKNTTEDSHNKNEISPTNWNKNDISPTNWNKNNISPTSWNKNDISPKLVIVNKDDKNIYYTWNIIVKGKYYYETLFWTLCFQVDKEYFWIRPKEVWYSPHYFWFCFIENNTWPSKEDKILENAKKLLNIENLCTWENEDKKCIKGEAEIEINNYKVNLMQSAACDQANLVKVISNKNQEYIKIDSEY